MRLLLLTSLDLTLAGLVVSSVGERNEQSAAVTAIIQAHKEEAVHYATYGSFTDLPLGHVDGYEITTTATPTRYRIVGKPSKREYRTYYSDQTMELSWTEDAR